MESGISSARWSGGKRDEVVTVRRYDGKVVEEEEEEEGERISGDSMRGEPYVEERASQTGLLALLVARKAGSCQPAYRRRALYGTRERNRVEAGDIPRGGQKGVARAREKSRGDRPVSLAVKSTHLKREVEVERERDTRCVKPKSRGRDRVMPRPFSTSVDRSGRAG